MHCVRVVIFCLLFVSPLKGEAILMEHLSLIADGLNVEGGTPGLSIPGPAKWANLCFVLDRPLITGIDLSSLTEDNPFPLKEASILEYNEAIANYVSIIAIHYYLMHAEEIVPTKKEGPLQVTVHVHRNSSGEKHCALLSDLMHASFPSLEKYPYVDRGQLWRVQSSFYYPNQNVIIHYRFGNQKEEISCYPEQDIVLSIGLISGLHHDWKSGSLCIPTNFIPFDLDGKVIHLDQIYQTPNHLLTVLPFLLEQQDDKTIRMFNNYYRSHNPEKKDHRVRKLRSSDFNEATLLQSNQYFYPNEMGNIEFTINADWQKNKEEVRMQTWLNFQTKPYLLPAPVGESVGQ